MIYEINHIWTAEMKWRWRNDRRSECNLCNCVKKPEKNSGLQRGLNPWPRDTGAILYQLRYEATDVGGRSIVGSYVPVKEMSVNYIWNKSTFPLSPRNARYSGYNNCKTQINCSVDLTGEVHGELVFLSVINIVLSITAFWGKYSDPSCPSQGHIHSSEIQTPVT